jgi:NADPH-dependent 2,4-dienoyl-CoA reductase/sulfur reductase-like enzyme
MSMRGTPSSVVIVGASLAGLSAAEAARKAGYDGAIMMIGAEKHLPYDRPPLSKSVLAGLADVETTILRPVEHYRNLGIELRLGEPVNSLDLDARVVSAGGDAIRFGALVIATGATARPLPDALNLSNVHVLRTWDDATRIRAAFDQAPRLVVVGGGFIGGEVAASARRRGLDVTVVDIDPLPMASVLGASFASDYVRLHEDHGVRVLRQVSVAALRGVDRVEAVELSDGRMLDADLVVAGLGASACVDWLDGSGVETHDGVICGGDLSTNVPGIYAAGDVVRQRRADGSTSSRSAHWTDAGQQGAVAGANAAGVRAAVEYSDPPFFWSMLYGSRIQVVGECGGAQRRQEILRSDELSGSGGAIALSVDGKEEVVGVCGWNAGRPFNRLRDWLVAKRRAAEPAPASEARALVSLPAVAPRLRATAAGVER